MRTIALDDSAQNNGLALIVSELLRSNIEAHPSKAKVFDVMNGSIAIVAEDASVGLTLRFEHGYLRIRNGIRGIPDIVVRAQSEDITNLSLIESEHRFGLPDVRKPIARSMVKKILRGEIQLMGVARNLRLFGQFGELMAVH